MIATLLKTAKRRYLNPTMPAVSEIKRKDILIDLDVRWWHVPALFGAMVAILAIYLVAIGVW